MASSYPNPWGVPDVSPGASVYPASSSKIITLSSLFQAGGALSIPLVYSATVEILNVTDYGLQFSFGSGEQTAWVAYVPRRTGRVLHLPPSCTTLTIIVNGISAAITRPNLFLERNTGNEFGQDVNAGFVSIQCSSLYIEASPPMLRDEGIMTVDSFSLGSGAEYLSSSLEGLTGGGGVVISGTSAWRQWAFTNTSPSTAIGVDFLTYGQFGSNYTLSGGIDIPPGFTISSDSAQSVPIASFNTSYPDGFDGLVWFTGTREVHFT